MHKPNALLISSILVSLLLVSAPVAADLFSEFDDNEDGKLSQEEAESIEGLDFSEFDLDGNGTLDEYEFDQAIDELELEPAPDSSTGD